MDGSVRNGLPENFMQPMTGFIENNRILNSKEEIGVHHIVYFMKYKYTDTHMYV